MQAQPDYGPALCVLGLIDAALGRKEAGLGGRSARDRASSRWKKIPSMAAACFSISRSPQRGQARKTLPCSNWNSAFVLPIRIAAA